MRYRRVFSLCIVMVLLAQPVLADVIATKTGEKFVGTLANREDVRSDPRAVDTIAMLLSESGELLRFRVADVEYIVLEDGNREEVIDLLSSPRRAASPGSPASPTMRKENYGTVLIALGFVAGAVGVVHKFGGPKCTIDESSVDCDEHSYDGVNYALMAGGGLLVVIGIVQSQVGDNDSRAESHSRGGTPILLLSRVRDEVRIGLGYRLVF